MDAKTLEALKASIAKWERNAVAQTRAEYRVGISECALCLVFHKRHSGKECVGCPIMGKTGLPFCSGTPYGEAEDAYYDWSRSAERARQLAGEEVAFLKSLLPAEEA